MTLQAFVEVLVDGIYNDPEHRAQRAFKGQYLSVAGGWYARSLVTSGLVAEVSEREYLEQSENQWFEGKNMEGLSDHLGDALAANGSQKPIQDLQSILNMANDLHDLDAALALAEQTTPDPFTVAQNWSEVEPDSFPQNPVTEEAKPDSPPPVAVNKDIAPPGRVPEKSVVKSPEPQAQTRKLVPESQGKRRRG